MAVSGGATVAYKCKLINGHLQRDTTTAQGGLLPLPATAAILRGETVTVAGSDVVVVARLVELELEIKHLNAIYNGKDELLPYG